MSDTAEPKKSKKEAVLTFVKSLWRKDKPVGKMHISTSIGFCRVIVFVALFSLCFRLAPIIYPA